MATGLDGPWDGSVSSARKMSSKAQGATGRRPSSSGRTRVRRRNGMEAHLDFAQFRATTERVRLFAFAGGLRRSLAFPLLGLGAAPCPRQQSKPRGTSDMRTYEEHLVKAAICDLVQLGREISSAPSAPSAARKGGPNGNEERESTCTRAPLRCPLVLRLDGDTSVLPGPRCMNWKKASNDRFAFPPCGAFNTCSRCVAAASAAAAQSAGLLATHLTQPHTHGTAVTISLPASMPLSSVLLSCQCLVSSSRVRSGRRRVERRRRSTPAEARGAAAWPERSPTHGSGAR